MAKQDSYKVQYPDFAAKQRFAHKRLCTGSDQRLAACTSCSQIKEEEPDTNSRSLSCWCGRQFGNFSSIGGAGYWLLVSALTTQSKPVNCRHFAHLLLAVWATQSLMLKSVPPGS
ncbi:hypothetical protein ABBQ38_006418 [Trebouxia sp. C0009 RCD-2024]